MFSLDQVRPKIVVDANILDEEPHVDVAAKTLDLTQHVKQPKLVGHWDFETARAFVLVNGDKIWSDGLPRQMPGKSSAVEASFVIDTVRESVRITGVWWDLVKGGSSATSSSSGPVHRSYGERKKEEDRDSYSESLTTSVPCAYSFCKLKSNTKFPRRHMPNMQPFQ
jgi:hypothetical protein